VEGACAIAAPQKLDVVYHDSVLDHQGHIPVLDRGMTLISAIHICCFPAKPSATDKVIGRKLRECLRESSQGKALAVNSSPFWHKLGFVDLSIE